MLHLAACKKVPEADESRKSENRKKNIVREMMVRKLRKKVAMLEKKLRQKKICESCLDLKEERDFLFRKCKNLEKQIRKQSENCLQGNSMDVNTEGPRLNPKSPPLTRDLNVGTPTVEREVQTNEDIVLVIPKIEIPDEATDEFIGMEEQDQRYYMEASNENNTVCADPDVGLLVKTEFDEDEERSESRSYLQLNVQNYKRRVGENSRELDQRGNMYAESHDEFSHLNEAGTQFQAMNGTNPDLHEPEDVEEAGDFEEPTGQILTCLWVSGRNGERCEERFESVPLMVIHVEEDHIPGADSKRHGCKWEGCRRFGLPFSARRKLAEHLRTHTGERPYRCYFKGCGRLFVRNQNLQIHLNTHSMRKFPCKFPGCTREFRQKQTAKDHYQIAHLSGGFKCHFSGCEQVFMYPSHLRRHEVVHTAEKGYECTAEGCGKFYPTRSELSKHIRLLHPQLVT